ncbi:hypothetical protein CF128_00800 [Aeromonas veronii]|nr:hypothetical protein CF128_00800 [Aeromonas veronii]
MEKSRSITICVELLHQPNKAIKNINLTISKKQAFKKTVDVINNISHLINRVIPLLRERFRNRDSTLVVVSKFKM